MELEKGDFLYHADKESLFVVIGQTEGEYQLAAPNWESVDKEEIETLVNNGSVVYWREEADHFELGAEDFKFFFNGSKMVPVDDDDDDDAEYHGGNNDITRRHWYSFEATGDSYADYYLEVEGGGDMIQSIVNGASIEPELQWIDSGGTRAAGRVMPGVTHAYAFDTLVADVTIQGDAHPMVDGKDSNLSYYPHDTASGDYWKTGFPWHDEEHKAPGEAMTDGGQIGGGEGYESAITSEDADVVVKNRSALRNALSDASSGDIVYIDGDSTIDLGSNTYTVPRGVTLASNRGINNAPGGRLKTDYKAGSGFYSLNLSRDSRITGLRFQGPYYEYFSPDFYAAGAAVTIRGNNVEIDNCEMWGFAYASIHVNTGSPHIHHNNIHHNPRAGLGYGVTNNGGDPLIEYNYFNANRHAIACSGEGGYTARYNYFGPITFSHILDAHEPGGTRYEIYNNTVEAVIGAHDDRQRAAVAVRGTPSDVATIHDNWFYNPDPPLDTPSGRFSEQAIIQVGVDDWSNVEWSNNHYGSDEPDGSIGHPR